MRSEFIMLPEINEIKRRRKQMNLTQNDLAKIAKVSQSLIAKVEAGKIIPTYDKAKRIFDSLEKLGMESALKVSDIMIGKIHSVKGKDSVKKAISLMERKGISQVPVIEHGHCIGAVSEKTIISKVNESEGKKLSEIKVSEVMDESLPVIQASTPVEIVSDLLNYNAALLVSKKGKLTGIVTKADLLKIMLRKKAIRIYEY